MANDHHLASSSHINHSNIKTTSPVSNSVDLTTNTTSNNASSSLTNLSSDRHDDDFRISLNDEYSRAYEACKNGDINAVKHLINASNVNLKDKHGRKSTFLHFAAGFGRKEVCEYLLNTCRADPLIKDEGLITKIRLFYSSLNDYN